MKMSPIQHSPALLQSTQKLFFWPMKPLVRPGPLATTLLASEWTGAPCWEQLMARVTGSTMTEEVSCILWLETSLEPEEEIISFPHVFEFKFQKSNPFPDLWSLLWRGFPRCGKGRHIWWRLDSCQGPSGCMWPCNPQGTPHSPSSPWRARQWSRPRHRGPQCWCSPQTRMQFLENWRTVVIYLPSIIQTHWFKVLTVPTLFKPFFVHKENADSKSNSFRFKLSCVAKYKIFYLDAIFKNCTRSQL